MKKENWILRAALSSSFFACGATALSAQACGNMPYLHQNKFDPEPIELSHVQGTAADQNGASVAQLCVGLFSAQKHELVRYAQSDAKGAFSRHQRPARRRISPRRSTPRLLSCQRHHRHQLPLPAKKAHSDTYEPARHRHL